MDTLAYTKALEAAGIQSDHAEARAMALWDNMLPQLATKADLDSLLVKITLIVAAINGVLFALLRFTS